MQRDHQRVTLNRLAGRGLCAGCVRYAREQPPIPVSNGSSISFCSFPVCVPLAVADSNLGTNFVSSASSGRWEAGTPHVPPQSVARVDSTR